MALITKPYTFTNGTVANAIEVNADLDTLYTLVNGNLDNANISASAAIAFSKLATLASGRILVGSAGGVATSVVVSGDATMSNTGVITIAGTAAGGIVPIGTIIAFYDFNGTLTFDSTRWGYCNGQSLNFTGIGAQTTPDLSGRYLVGFGTDGGGNNGSASWATATVGNAGNTVNIQHSHDLSNHTHSINSHTHTISSDGSHAHTGNTTGMSTTVTDVTTYSVWDWDGANRNLETANFVLSVAALGGGGGYNAREGQHDHVISSDGSHTHTGNTGGTSASTAVPSANITSNGLSTTQSIQPISIRVRYLIRYT